MTVHTIHDYASYVGIYLLKKELSRLMGQSGKYSCLRKLRLGFKGQPH